MPLAAPVMCTTLPATERLSWLNRAMVSLLCWGHWPDAPPDPDAPGPLWLANNPRSAIPYCVRVMGISALHNPGLYTFDLRVTRVLEFAFHPKSFYIDAPRPHFRTLPTGAGIAQRPSTNRQGENQ